MNICRTPCARGLGPVLAAVLVLSLGACSWVPDWADPVEWYKDTTSLFDSDKGSAKERKEARTEKDSPGSDQPFPSLSTVPERPKMASPKDRQKVEQGLVADRADARHEEIRPASARGDDFGAPPPPVIAEPPSPVHAAKETEKPATKPAAEQEASAKTESKAPESPPEQQAEAAPPPPPPPAKTEPAPPPAKAEVKVTPPPAPEPAKAAPPPPAARQVAAAPKAPPPARVTAPQSAIPPQGTDSVQQAYQAALNEYALQNRLAKTGGLMPNGDIPRDVRKSPVPSTAGALPVPPSPASNIHLKPPAPEGQAPAREPGAPASPPPQLAVGQQAASEIPHSGTASAHLGTIRFANGSARVERRYDSLLKRIAKTAKAKRGMIRVVGHASKRTRDVDALRHRIANFRISMERARAVANRLERLGVPASRVSVVAMSDNEPIYYEFMPAGEAGNRRAEIYLDY